MSRKDRKRQDLLTRRGFLKGSAGMIAVSAVPGILRPSRSYASADMAMAS